jgi:hypothetical protein
MCRSGASTALFGPISVSAEETPSMPIVPAPKSGDWGLALVAEAKFP